MVATISLTDFDCLREDYHYLRLGIFNHQPSGVEANERDLNLFSHYFHDRNIDRITGEGILSFLTYLREERDNVRLQWTPSVARELGAGRSKRSTASFCWMEH